MSELTPSVVTLGLGLDLYSSPIKAPVGSLTSCENYEVTDAEGLRRMDGTEPLDARISPATSLFYKISVSAGTVPAVDDLIVYTQVNVGPTTGKVTITSTDIVAGVVVESDAAYFVLAAVNDTYLDQSVNLGIFNTTTGVVSNVGTVTSCVLYETTSAVPATITTGMRTYFDTLRARITSLGSPAAGLHWFRDKYIAVASVPRIVITAYDSLGGGSAGTWTFSAPNGSIIGNDVNSAKVYLANLTFVTNGSGVRTYRADAYMVRGTYKQWNDAMTAGGLITGAIIVPGTFAAAQDAAGPTSAGANTSAGYLWKAQSEQTAIESAELPLQLGWKPIELPFTLSFNNGTYSTEEPPKLERTFATIPTTATYYLTDGVNILSFDLVSYFVDELTGGSFVAGTATGTMQIRNIQVIAGAYDTIDTTYDIHTANPPLVGNKLGDVSVAMAPVTLPLIAALEEANSRYLFTTNNFYGDDEWDAMYGVNGVGRSFYYDDNLFALIYTQSDSTYDVPRHIAAHHQHLALGFVPGSVQLSVIGEPHNFRGIDGASELSVGDRVTGLAPLNGTTLGVFCEQSIWSISGTTVDNFQTGVLSPNTGCLEYTLVTMGVPVYCDNFGIRTLDQTAAYGDFIGKPLSRPVARWLRKRLRRIGGHFNDQSSIVAALPVREKNQYRLYFRDGYVLTMTLMEGAEAQFTMQQPKIIVSDVHQPFVPYALCSEMDQYGHEQIAASFLDTKNNMSTDYVYELDAGWGWQGYPMSHSFELNFFFGATPSTYFKVQKARLYGLTHGLASLKIQASGAQSQLTTRYSTAYELLDLPGTEEVWMSEEVQRNSKPATLSNRGIALQLKVSERQTTLTEPSHTAQVLVLATTSEGAFDV